MTWLSKHPQIQSILSWFRVHAGTSTGRILSLLIVGLLVGGAVFGHNLLGSKHNTGARGAADSFLRAFESCDTATMAKYDSSYLSSDKSDNFEATCTKGEDHFTYVKSLGETSMYGRSDVGKTVSLQYLLTEEDKQGSCRVVVTLISGAGIKNWIIFGVVPTDYTPACLALSN